MPALIFLFFLLKHFFFNENIGVGSCQSHFPARFEIKFTTKRKSSVDTIPFQIFKINFINFLKIISNNFIGKIIVKTLASRVTNPKDGKILSHD